MKLSLRRGFLGSESQLSMLLHRFIFDWDFLLMADPLRSGIEGGGDEASVVCHRKLDWDAAVGITIVVGISLKILASAVEGFMVM
jgi:hypothetical protein